MKRLFRGMAIVLAMLLMCAPAMAEMQRGSTGDLVYYLQELLFETGWLFEEPDGVFGKNTEQAVRDYEAYAGLPVDGVADGEMMATLEEDWFALMVELGQIDFYDNGDGAMADGRYPDHCIHYDVSDGYSGIDYCENHANLSELSGSLLATGEEADARQAFELWRAEVIRMYDEWLARADDAGKADIVASRALLLSGMEAQLRAVSDCYETVGADAYRYMETAMREQAVWLCAMIGGMADASAQ